MAMYPYHPLAAPRSPAPMPILAPCSPRRLLRWLWCSLLALLLAGPALAQDIAFKGSGFFYPAGVAVDAAGNLYVAEVIGHRVRKVDAITGNTSAVAGWLQGSSGFSGDGGPATAAQLSAPYGIALDAAGNLYIADSGNHRIRKVDAATGDIHTVAGTAGVGGDGGQATAAQLSMPQGVFVDAAGNLYIAEYNGRRIRKVDGAGVISTVAGGGAAPANTDGVQATAVALGNLTGVTMDAAGNLFIAEFNNNRVRKVDSAGIISTVAGNGVRGFGGDGGPATAAQLSHPYHVAVDTAGNLHITDSSNLRIRQVDAATGAISSTVGLGDVTTGLALDAAGDLYFAIYVSGPARKLIALPPYAPTAASAVAGNAQATVSWTAPANGGRPISGYTVTTVEDSTKTCTPTPATATTCTVSGLVNGTGYTFTVVASNSVGAGAASAPSTVATPHTIPGAPTAVSAVAGNAQATVGWTAPSSNGGAAIASYTVTAVQDNTKTCTPAPATATTCTVAGLANGTGYTFTVVASNSAGPGAASAPSTQVTPLGTPGAPTAVTAVAGNARATVSWTAPTDNGGTAVTSYTVAAVQDSTKTCTPAPATATTCTVAGLAYGTAYTFTVVASNSVGPGTASAPSAPVTMAAPDTGPSAPSMLPVNSAGTTTITDPTLPIVVGAGAENAIIVLPASTGGTPVRLQFTINNQPLEVQASPGTQLRVAQVNGQSVLVVQQGFASMTSTAAGQPMALAGTVLLSAGQAGTTIEVQPFTVAVLTGALLPPQGSLPQLGRMGLQAGERLQVNEQGAVVSITLGSLAGNTSQPGDPMVFANLPAAITVDSKVFARLAGPLARLSGVNLAQGLEATASGVLLMRDGGQLFQLLPTLPITIDATLPDGLSFTPLGLLRWVRGGVVVQFAPAVADLAGLANAVTAVLPGAQIRLGAEGVVQLRTGGRTYVLKPGWTGAGSATGTPQIGVDEQGHIYLQTGNGTRQLLLPALLNATQAQAVFQAALPGATLAVQPQANDGAFTVTLAGQSWRLVPQWLLPEGAAAQVPAPSANWWMGADGLLYLKLGSLVQGVRAVD